VKNAGTDIHPNLTWEHLRVFLGNWVQFHPLFARIGGGALPGLMLSTLYKWDGKGRLPDGWIYKSGRDWFDETYMTRGELERARKALVSRGLIEAEARGLPRTWHYRINREALLESVGEETALAGSKLQFADVVQTGKPSRKSSFHTSSKLVGTTPANLSATVLQTGLQTGCKHTALETTEETSKKTAAVSQATAAALSEIGVGANGIARISAAITSGTTTDKRVTEVVENLKSRGVTKSGGTAVFLILNPDEKLSERATEGSCDSCCQFGACLGVNSGLRAGRNLAPPA
jgi:hypothetical protein